MSILDGILGNNSSRDVDASSSEIGGDVAAAPGLGLVLNDVLSSSNSRDDGGSSSSNEFTGIGGLGVGFEAPAAVSFDASSDQFSASDRDGSSDGLLGGLL